VFTTVQKFRPCPTFVADSVVLRWFRNIIIRLWQSKQTSGLNSKSGYRSKGPR